MGISIALIAAILILNPLAAIWLLWDMRKHKEEMQKEPGNLWGQRIFAVAASFLSAFGISDYAIATVFYNKLGWVPTKKLPGTLNTQTMMPVALISLAYIIGTEADIITLIPCMLMQIAGGICGSRFTAKMNAPAIKKVLSIGLFLAGGLILANKFTLISLGGEALGLYGWRLPLTAAVIFFIGFAKSLGIGSYPLTIILAFFLGLHPIVAYILMMGGGALSGPFASWQFLKMQNYSRRLTLYFTTYGLIGVILAVFIVRSLDINLLQWVMAVVVIWAALDMLLSSWRRNKPEEEGLTGNKEQ